MSMKRGPHTSTALENFAARVQAEADQADYGFGDRKVFIVQLWGAMDNVGDLDDFKAKLLQANRKGLLRLHRADLVGEMNPYLVRESEVRDGDARLHFVERSRPSATFYR